MATPKDPYSILNKDPNRGKIVPKKFTKVNRLWPGKAPKYANEQNEEGFPDNENLENKKQEIDITGIEAPKRQPQKTEIIVSDDKKNDDKKDEIIKNEEIKEIQVNLPQKSDEELERYFLRNIQENYREKLKQKLLENEGKDEEEPDAFNDIPEQIQENIHKTDKNEVMNDNLSENSESEDEPMQTKPLLKPMFVGKDDRITIKEREKKIAEEEKRLEEERKRKEELKIETKNMIIKAVFFALF